MSENPEAIRADIEATRERLGTSVDAVADKVTPSSVVHRQTDRVKETVKDAVFGTKEKVMGAADHASGDLHAATGSAGPAMGDAGSAISDAPHQAAVKTQGNPLAAGLIAFGAGLLVSALVPASQKEREAADALKSVAEPVTTQLTEAAKEMAEGLKEPAREAVENVKATAADAAENVKGEGQAAVSAVKDQAADAKDHVQQA
jgi:gas vesicle protein